MSQQYKHLRDGLWLLMKLNVLAIVLQLVVMLVLYYQ